VIPVRADRHEQVAAAVTGKRAALQRLLATARPFVTQYCRARLGQRDGVAREVLRAVLDALPHYREQDGSFLSFVYRIAAPLTDAYEPACPGPIDLLPPQQREILVLRAVVGMSTTETATILQCTEARVRLLQHRALNTMRASLPGQDQVHGDQERGGMASRIRGVADAERARLLEQCELYRMEAELLFDRIGVDSGWQALDLGCGPPGVLDILAERVGAAGSVVGLDRERRVLQLDSLSPVGQHLAGIELVPGEATATGLPTGSFDLVHERLMLVDVARPEDVVAEMVRLTRPGGYVALQDMDVISWTCEPSHPAWDALRGALAAGWVGDPRIGRRLPALLRAAGLVDVDVDVHVGLSRSGEPAHTLLQRFVATNRHRILATGSLTASELDECLRDVEQHLAQPDTLVLGWTLFQSWGRTP
jgi:DNA-directed RNA polymerase specialized sigma24 family protein